LIIFFDRLARPIAAQVSIDDRRRCELATILCDKECREAVQLLKKQIIHLNFRIFYFLAYRSMDGFNRRKTRNRLIKYCNYI